MLYQQSFRMDYQREVQRIRRRSSLDHRKQTPPPPAPSAPGSVMKGIFILSLCAVYTMVLFSCVAVIKTVAILVMGQPLSIKALAFKKEKSEVDVAKYDRNFNRYHLEDDPVTKFIVDSEHCD